MFRKYIYKLLNGGWFWGLGAMIGETMMKFSGSCTMRVSGIGIFLRNLPIALTLMVQLPGNIIIVSPLSIQKFIYTVYGGYVSQVFGCAAGRNVQPIAIKFGTKL